MNLNHYCDRDTINQLAVRLVMSCRPESYERVAHQLIAAEIDMLVALAADLGNLPIIDARTGDPPLAINEVARAAIAASLAMNRFTGVRLTLKQIDEPKVRQVFSANNSPLATTRGWERLFSLGHADNSLLAPNFSLAMQFIGDGEYLVIAMHYKDEDACTLAPIKASLRRDYRRLLEEFMRGECDGTYSSETEAWSLELRRGIHNEADPVGAFIDRLAIHLEQHHPGISPPPRPA